MGVGWGVCGVVLKGGCRLCRYLSLFVLCRHFRHNVLFASDGCLCFVSFANPQQTKKVL